MKIRSEISADRPAIQTLTVAAFEGVAHSSGTEAAIVDALRDNGALSISLVAEAEGAILGHVAFSPVLIEGVEDGWFGLGPVSVLPVFQRRGIGTALIEEGLRVLETMGAKGCVVLGDPGYYGRFGFTSAHTLYYGDAPAPYFQSLALTGEPAAGEVAYHAGFGAS